MLNIHATKKLLKKIDPKYQHGLSVVASSPMEEAFSHWHANLLQIQRRQCVLFVHDATRFPVLVIGLTKPDFANMAWHFEDVFVNTLLKIGATDVHLRNAERLLSNLTLRFDHDCNRSVQGTMNQMTQDFEWSLHYDSVSITDVSAYRASVWLAGRPCTIKGQKDCIWPVEAMLVLLNEPNQYLQLDFE